MKEAHLKRLHTVWSPLYGIWNRQNQGGDKIRGRQGLGDRAGWIDRAQRVFMVEYTLHNSILGDKCHWTWVPTCRMCNSKGKSSWEMWTLGVGSVMWWWGTWWQGSWVATLAGRNLWAPSRLCRESNTALKNCLNLKTNTVTFIC